MNKLLNNLSIRSRMLLSVSLFLVTLLYSMVAAYNSIGANLEFSVQEKRGDAYQRPLAGLLAASGKLRVALAEARTGVNSAQDIKDLISSIASGMEDLKSVQATYGEALQFTDEGLKSRGRENLKYEAVAQKWNETSKAISANIAGDHDAGLASFIADLRGMISHSGDTSNLILDPDLDTYYLMDVTLLALPQTIDRITAISSALYPQLAKSHVLSGAERTEAAVMARMLKESDIVRIDGDMDTSLKEDANFHGSTPEYQKNGPALRAGYDAKNAVLEDLLTKIGAGEAVAPEEMKAAAAGAAEASATFLTQGYDELDRMIEVRVDGYRHDQMVSVATSIFGIVLSMLFYMLVVRSITSPLAALAGAMRSLSSGNLDVAVPYAGEHSEIGDMASSVQVFKQNAADKIAMEQAQKAQEASAREDRKIEMAMLAKAFEDRIKGIIDALSQGASGLSGTANDMAGFITQSTRTAREASDSANLTSQNMQSVAAAAEEMAVTIQEISSQIQRTNQFIADSVQKAGGAEQHAGALKDASQKVRDVTRLIAEIAGQTNLLALNATIEAARAGEAGKGFAVVATEVKNLAAQTDKSIQDIDRVISEMSQATEGVVTSLSGIKSAVDKIYETSSGIASAVEEQSATVNDIVKNMQTASSGTVQVSQNISTVTKLSGEASQSSQQVLVAANDLSKQAEQLDFEVASFLSEVRG
jgi:methyl-accepting chemotaxis protein